MNDRTKNIPAKRMKVILIGFCILGAGFSAYLMAEAIFRKDKDQPELKIDQVNIPKYYDKTGGEELQNEQYVDRETYQRVESFERYMDSLRQTTPGQRIYDSVLLTRPGLMDSVKMLKEIYQSQINK